MARIEAEVPDEADARSVEPEGVSTTVDRRLSVTRAGLGETMHAAVCERAMTSVGSCVSSMSLPRSVMIPRVGDARGKVKAAASTPRRALPRGVSNDARGSAAREGPRVVCGGLN